MEKISKSGNGLDLDPTMSNVFISYNIFKFQDPRSFIFLVILLTQRIEIFNYSDAKAKQNMLFVPENDCSLFNY